MEMSKRNKSILIVLCTILVTVLYYNFIFVRQSEKLSTLKEEEAEKEDEYSILINEVNGLDNVTTNLDNVRNNIIELTSDLYPTISQENLILELDDLLESSGLSSDISFSSIQVSSVDFLSTSDDTTTDTFDEESDYFQSVDSYDGDVDDFPEEVETTTDSTTTSSDEETETTSFETVEQMSIALSFTGTYEQLQAFIGSIDNYDRKIAITDISISANSETTISGTISLEVYAVPQITDDDLQSYIKWDLSNIYGKDSPFSTSSATGAYSSTVEESTTDEDINDFVMMVRSGTSDFPSLTIGRANDSSTSTYLYEDNNEEEQVEIEFTEVDGVLYYKYSTSDSSYPVSSSSNGEEFTTVSDDIVIDITSEDRVSSTDNSALSLKVINNTSKNVEVVINDDDTENPRVSVTSEGGTVDVTKN